MFCDTLVLVVALVALNDLLFQLHFELRHQSRADVALSAAAGFRFLGAFGDQRTGYRRDGAGSVAGPHAARRWGRQARSAGGRRLGPGAAGAPLRAALRVADKELIGRVGEFEKGHPEGPRLLVLGSPLNDATRRHNPVQLGVAHVHSRGKQDRRPN